MFDRLLNGPRDRVRSPTDPKRRWVLFLSYLPEWRPSRAGQDAVSNRDTGVFANKAPFPSDWLFSILLFGIIVGVADSSHGFKREFSLTDTSIQHTYAIHERVTFGQAILIAGLAPAVIIIVTGLGWRRSMWDMHNGLLGLFLAVTLTTAVTEVIKVTVGRPRPDLIDSGFKSFPSGHSSFAFSGLGYLSLYLAGKMHLFDRKGHALKAWVCVIPLLGAALIAISRTMGMLYALSHRKMWKLTRITITDYRHHATDVLIGSLLGVLIAYFTYSLYYPPLNSHKAHLPYSPRIPRHVNNNSTALPTADPPSDEDVPARTTITEVEVHHNLATVEPRTEAGGLRSSPNSRALRLPKLSHLFGSRKKSRRPLWIVFGITVAVLVILGAVVGGVVGSRDAADNSQKVAKAGAAAGTSTGGTANGGSGNPGIAVSSGTYTIGAEAGLAKGVIWPTATDANGAPLYPTTTGSAKISMPTLLANASLSCGEDPYDFADPSSLAVRTEHPLLFAASYKWICLQRIVPQDEYMSFWNDTIFLNATRYYAMAPTNYSIDGGLGGSGVLDVAREVQLRIKHWGYAYKMSNDTKWVDRTWLEIQTAAGNSTTGQYFGITGDNWNAIHFLDLAEFTVAFAMAYDWFFDAWTPTQKEAIMWSILELGLKYGYQAYAEPTTAGADYSWWTSVNGNWNCVCSGGMIIGALSIMNEDPTGMAAKVLELAVPNIRDNCAFSPSSDGTWSETANYWYYGTTGHTQAASALLSATGSTQEILTSNPAMVNSSLYHMYVTGMQGLFTYGDTGPNRFTATANGLMFYASQYNIPMYSLFQRDRADAPEPMSMMYYDPQVSGDFWDGLALDHHFENTTDGWVSMRSSWTDTDGTYVAMKAGALLNHQTHGDLDTGDFVLDAVGQRWAGELGDGELLFFYSPGFPQLNPSVLKVITWPPGNLPEKRTEGQNTLLMGGKDQNVEAIPTTTFGSSGDVQTSLVYNCANSSTAYFAANLTSTYNGTSTHRAIRFLNGRKQILLQDEMDVPAEGTQWRMQTNATISMSNGNKTATLELGGQTMIAEIIGTSDAVWGTELPLRLSTDPTLPSGVLSQDQPLPGVTVLTIQIPTGQQTLEVLFNPQWENFNADSFITPPSVAIVDWTVTSHDV
ncbi:diacylglycerol diphosphate phosphatase / phosphatidate phosphatase, partial [Phenoliferia sp. Uapishka_3]